MSSRNPRVSSEKGLGAPFISATPERGCVEDQPQQPALTGKSDLDHSIGVLRLVLRTQSRSNNLEMLAAFP